MSVRQERLQLIEAITAQADGMKLSIPEVKFRGWLAMLYGHGALGSMSDVQLSGLRVAFISGMILYQGDVLDAFDAPGEVSPEEEARLAAYCNRIREDLEAFADAVVMPVKGSA